MQKRKLKRSIVKIVIIGISIFLPNLQHSYASQNETDSQLTIENDKKQELINLSKQKWQWMSECNIDSLNKLFHEKAEFVHMGGTMNKEQELNTIRSGNIHYKHAAIEKTTVRFVENTAIILDKIRLTAVVGGNEVVNPFMVSEVYVQIGGQWQLVLLSFTKLLNG